jgi:uncharacterized protein (DUF952 family)
LLSLVITSRFRALDSIEVIIRVDVDRSQCIFIIGYPSNLIFYQPLEPGFLMIKNLVPKYWYMLVLLTLLSQNSVAASEVNTAKYVKKYPFVYHLVQKDLWNRALEANTAYYPPTYSQDKFTHATANPDFLLTIGNHFYPDVKGDWFCLRMSVDSLSAMGVRTIFEGTAPVGNKEADFEGTDSELFPHILGGIHPSAVLQAHDVVRDSNGRFLSVTDVVADTPVTVTGTPITGTPIAGTTLYHIVSEKELQMLTEDNVYTPVSVELEGYIHFSKLELIMPIANDAYIDRKVLFLLQVTFGSDDKDLRWIGDNPDYYRGLDLAMVEKKIKFTRNKNGLWEYPIDFQ